ncbi:MAG: GNAT family N-acetyltransferase [Ruminiclostridium sp.]|nr:GNAT family N-acetyltransferase [Ruminiclostridium sp.]
MKRLETERLILRAVEESDTRAVFENWANDPQVTRYMTWNPHRSIEDTRMIMDYWLSEYGKDTTYRWVIVPKNGQEPVGMIDVVGYDDDGSAIIGYCEARKMWNRGYMTEALKAVTALLLEDGIKKLKISAVDENKASNRVIQKAGFTYVDSVNTPLSPVKPELVTLNNYIMEK